MQNAYGGADDGGQISYLSTVNNSGEVIDSKNGGVVVEAHRNFMQIQWPLMDFGIGNRKVITGLQIIDSGRGTTTFPFTGTQVAVQFGWHGQYLPNESSPTYASTNLNNATYTPPYQARSQIIRKVLATNFEASTFFLQQQMQQWLRTDAIRIRLTVHEEP
jgi:hypothetical protein